MARALVGMAIAAALLVGCDVKSPKPEIGNSAATAPAPGVEHGSALPGERSLRLFGRGVHRQRQIRV